MIVGFTILRSLDSTGVFSTARNKGFGTVHQLVDLDDISQGAIPVVCFFWGAVCQVGRLVVLQRILK